MRKHLINFLLWLAGLLGWKPEKPPQPAATSKYIEQAMFVVRQIEEKFHGTSGEFKRAQALRMMLNITNAPERDCAKAIEEAVEICHPR